MSTLSPQKPDPYGYDFAPIEPEIDEDMMDNWSYYQKLCYSQNPPVPVLSAMKPLCDGSEYSAKFKHYKIGKHIDIILQVLLRLKTISELDLCDNGLGDTCIDPLAELIKNSDNLSSLDLSNNTHIRSKAMSQILEGLSESKALESLNISNTGCMLLGKALATVVQNCYTLQNIYLSNCGLGNSVIDFAKAIPMGQKLRMLDLSANRLHTGGKKLALTLGQNIAKSSTISIVNLSKNALTSEQTISLLRPLSDSPHLKTLDLSGNSIGDEAGRAISNFIMKAAHLKHLDISGNPVLNVTINYSKLKSTQADDKDKNQGNKKDKKPKDPVPGAFLILNACGKSGSLKDITMIGLVTRMTDWKNRVDAVQEQNQKLKVLYTSEMSAAYDFRHGNEDPLPEDLPVQARPQTAQPAKTTR
ncbi:Leucine Rich Repeat family protein [Trichomonas vaginalis G3]|uniref:Leucine Rich Repeat family protein n=1 Tax=Trichomonas vaginalis (strain ATCC PRA-98 / G3) TaxID=412133 RepID=A2ETM5_TRIV3|nr:uncharacterized protein TVAGG3_0404090 [Trichomonas vaginalis G3]EAY03993.1 Leucine Rich Repeat family protein [Trichomonas vaginalis G3]KAI5534907.1 interleukin-8 biosynthetic process [Trichomonas vaginalis G3]|eukprot:XP_001316216.1 hypothetical protein [Trichomonas vaginalis G3]